MLGYISYVVYWPPIFAFTILPGVLIGSRIRTWQLGVVVAEVLTLCAVPTMTGHFFVEWLFLMHLILLPPLLLSILIGHFGARD